MCMHKRICIHIWKVYAWKNLYTHMKSVYKFFSCIQILYTYEMTWYLSQRTVQKTSCLKLCMYKTLLYQNCVYIKEFVYTYEMTWYLSQRTVQKTSCLKLCMYIYIYSIHYTLYIYTFHLSITKDRAKDVLPKTLHV